MEECYVSWVNEDVIPKSVLEEYKENTLVEVQQSAVEGIGQTSHTLNVNVTRTEQEPKEKKKKLDRVTVNCNDGYVSYQLL